MCTRPVPMCPCNGDGADRWLLLSAPCRFHEMEPQKNLPLLVPSQLSQLVVYRAKRTVPYPLLGENTMVLSDVLCVCETKDGNLCLTCRWVTAKRGLCMLPILCLGHHLCFCAAPVALGLRMLPCTFA
jgi:hypothetical protein